MKAIKVGIIGLGNWGTCHLESFHSMPQVEVVAICDKNREKAFELASRYGVEYAYEDSEQLLSRDDLDLVSIVTLENEHFPLVMRAMETGKHVLVEKPISLKLEEAQAMLQAATQHDQLLFAGHLLRFETRYADIYQAIRSGHIGRAESMYFKRGRTKGMFQTYKRMHTVYLSTVHDLDLAIWYAGCRVKRVKAYSKAVQDGTSPDILWACLTFENGSIAFLQSNWMLPDEAGIAMNDEVEIIGVNGIAQFANNGSNLKLWDDKGLSMPGYFIHRTLNGSSFGALREQLNYICNCIDGGKEAKYTSFEDAVHGIEVAEAILQSCESGAEINLIE